MPMYRVVPLTKIGNSGFFPWSLCKLKISTAIAMISLSMKSGCFLYDDMSLSPFACSELRESTIYNGRYI